MLIFPETFTLQDTIRNDIFGSHSIPENHLDLILKSRNYINEQLDDKIVHKDRTGSDLSETYISGAANCLEKAGLLVCAAALDFDKFIPAILIDKSHASFASLDPTKDSLFISTHGTTIEYTNTIQPFDVLVETIFRTWLSRNLRDGFIAAAQDSAEKVFSDVSETSPHLVLDVPEKPVNSQMLLIGQTAIDGLFALLHYHSAEFHDRDEVIAMHSDQLPRVTYRITA